MRVRKRQPCIVPRLPASLREHHRPFDCGLGEEGAETLEVRDDLPHLCRDRVLRTTAGPCQVEVAARRIAVLAAAVRVHADVVQRRQQLRSRVRSAPKLRVAIREEHVVSERVGERHAAVGALRVLDLGEDVVDGHLGSLVSQRQLLVCAAAPHTCTREGPGVLPEVWLCAAGRAAHCPVRLR